MTRRWLIFIAIIAFVVCCGFLVWRVQDTRARAEKLESEILKELTSEEIGLVLKNHLVSDPETASVMKENSDARKAFLKKIQGILALAAQARREGMADDPNFLMNFEYQKNGLLQKMYVAEMDKARLKALFPPEAFQAVWNRPENEVQFKRDVEAMKAAQAAYTESREIHSPNSRLEGEKLERARKEWAARKTISDMAKADPEFIQKPEINFRFKILEAGILASDYSNKHWQKVIKANDKEIAAYLANHPEYDLGKKREKAEMILRRAKSGEDFGKLASEFSEDRPTKVKGGLYENVERNFLWLQVESVALSMEKGQIADKLIESDVGLHIVKSEGKQMTKDKDGRETVKFSVRHILLQNAFEEPNNKRPGVPPPFLKAEEIAKSEVEKRKYEEFVADVIRLNQISLPEDFVNELSENTETYPLTTLGVSATVEKA